MNSYGLSVGAKETVREGKVGVLVFWPRIDLLVGSKIAEESVRSRIAEGIAYREREVGKRSLAGKPEATRFEGALNRPFCLPAGIGTHLRNRPHACREKVRTAGFFDGLPINYDNRLVL
jgi:hypothetical protein